MDQIKYFTKQLKLISSVLENVKLSLRKDKSSIKYKSCIGIYEDIICTENMLESNDDLVSPNDMLYLFSKTFLWCAFYGKEITDIPTQHIVILLSNQMRKRTKKLIQSIKDREKVKLAQEILGQECIDDDEEDWDSEVDPSIIKFIYGID